MAEIDDWYLNLLHKCISKSEQSVSVLQAIFVPKLICFHLVDSQVRNRVGF